MVGFRSGMPTNFIGALAERLSDPSPRVRWQAVSSLARFHKNSSMVVPLIIRVLGDSEASVRRAAIQALTTFGPQARLALPELGALAERDLENRRFALDCIGGIDLNEADRLADKFRMRK